MGGAISTFQSSGQLHSRTSHSDSVVERESVCELLEIGVEIVVGWVGYSLAEPGAQGIVLDSTHSNKLFLCDSTAIWSCVCGPREQLCLPPVRFTLPFFVENTVTFCVVLQSRTACVLMCQWMC